jgi:glycosyltransferase involved in cell wall biosynthesis
MRCLESIPVSEDIQVIVVDDNSPGADTYLQEYPALSRPFLEFIRSDKNGGGGYARNIGLTRARGKWLLFADADDFFAKDMHDIISNYYDTDADVVIFRAKKVHSDNLHLESDRDAVSDKRLELFIQTGDEWALRFRHYLVWSKLIRRNLVIENKILFDEVRYSNDCFFSINVGYYARKIMFDDNVLYWNTFRSGSDTACFCQKPGELRIRAEVSFRLDQFLLQHDICRERDLTWFLTQMLKTDRSLFKYYFNHKLDEIYPSRIDAIKDICRGHSLMTRCGIWLYALLIWKRA